MLDTAGIAVEFASIAGGWAPYDAYDEKDQAQKAFFESKAFRRLNRSRKLSEVDAADYDAILIPGGLGPMVDLARNAEVQKAVVRSWSTGKFVTAVCHGPCSLLGVDLGDGVPFVRGKKLTAFSKKEEYDYARDDVPFELEDALRAEGAEYLLNRKLDAEGGCRRPTHNRPEPRFRRPDGEGTARGAQETRLRRHPEAVEIE